jgi:hypothetical protein
MVVVAVATRGWWSEVGRGREAREEARNAEFQALLKNAQSRRARTGFSCPLV